MIPSHPNISFDSNSLLQIYTKSFIRAFFYTLFGINLIGRIEADSTNLKDGTYYRNENLWNTFI